MNATASLNRSTRSKAPIMSAAELNLFTASGEELLLMAIAGREADRERIGRELDLRALLGEGPRRVRTSRAATRIRHRRAA